MSLYRGAVVQGALGTYRVENLLTEGGMGRIFLGTSSTGQRLVIKEPKFKGDTDDAARLEKLRVEAEILKAINHPHVVRYLDSRDEGKTFYLVLEYIPGKSMIERFRARPSDEGEARRYILTVLEVLQYVHKMNIIHRDINPKNILLRPDAVLIDFGAAKHNWNQILTFGHTIVGTPGWSAPEQFTGQVDQRCDIYAVGATLFFLLTGEEPRLHIGADCSIKSPQSVNSRVTDDMSRIILKAMDPIPSKRFQLADDMAAELQGRRVVHARPCVFCRGKKHEITGKLTIGRSSSNDVPIDDPQLWISRQHAEIYGDAGKYWIRDIGSVNGVWVYQQGVFQRVYKYELKNGDLIALAYNSRKGPYVTLTYNSGA